jgi:hypothetical protein
VGDFLALLILSTPALAEEPQVHRDIAYASAVYRRVAHRKMALSEAAIPCLRWRFRLVKAGGYKPEAPAKAISEAPRRPDNPSATPL